MKTVPLVLLSMLGLCPGLPGKVVYVDDNASADGNGTSWANAHKYLQDALANCAGGDDIWVAEGTYRPDQGAGVIEGNRTMTFNLVDGVGLYGGFSGKETTRAPTGDHNRTILSGEIDVNSTHWSLHVVSGENLTASTIVDGFRISNGNASERDANGSGAGMFLSHSSITISNCIFSGNDSWWGGSGIYNEFSSPTLTHCVFTDNGTWWGGSGIFNDHNSSPILRYCVFSDNNGVAMDNNNSSPSLIYCVFSKNRHGGMFNDHNSSPSLGYCAFSNNKGRGMYNDRNSSPTLSNCIFVENSVSGNGGGMYNNRSSSPVLVNCVFAGNGASGNGGGMYNTFSSPVLVNCAFSRNGASGNGGAMFNFNSFPALANCTFAGNWASGSGGGMFNEDSSPKITHSIYWQNFTQGSLAWYMDHGIEGNWTNETDVPIIAQGWTGDERAVSVDPLFVNIHDPDGPDDVWFTKDDGLRLLADSPAIDLGGNDFTGIDLTTLSQDERITDSLSFDLAGFKRLQGSFVDLGPYEYGELPLVLAQTHDPPVNDDNRSWVTPATGLGNGWINLHWYGNYHESSDKWLYHELDGWLFVGSKEGGEFWLYSHDLGWIWTTETVFPHTFRASTRSWLYFGSGTDSCTCKKVRRYYDYSKKKWFMGKEESANMIKEIIRDKKNIEEAVSEIEKLDVLFLDWKKTIITELLIFGNSLELEKM